MSELEKFLEGSTLGIGTIGEFMDYCRTHKPLIAIQLNEQETDGSHRFVAFSVRGIEEADSRFTPLPDGRVYDGSFHEGNFVPHLDCSFPLARYPVSVTQEDLVKREVLILRPESYIAQYILKFMESGMIEARRILIEK